MMSRLAKFSLIALFIPSLAAVGCGAGDGGSTAGEQEIGDGKICGGFAGLSCPSGQRCVITDTHPDATGKCAAQTAQTCGGIAGLACPSGQSCVITASHPDATGTCAVPAAKKGERCGGNVLGAKQCAAGLTCAGQNGGGVAGNPGTCE